MHVLRHVRDGDILIIDNYELIYVLAARITRLFRRITILLDYEDGKHLIDRALILRISLLAEKLGRGMIQGALLASPGLKIRMPEGIPTELVPGFITGSLGNRLPVSGKPLRFLYSGSLDPARGGDVLVAVVKLLPAEGWQLDVTGGIGEYAEELSRLSTEVRFRGKLRFQGSLPEEELQMLARECQVGLNLQKSSDPISDVTFPSKLFSYFSQGLHVISTRASHVESVCGQGCLYLDAETPEALAAIMIRVIRNPSLELSQINTARVSERYSIESSADRLSYLIRQSVNRTK
jgi:glycosyltransferase involved in cell wall biosynthesis